MILSYSEWRLNEQKKEEFTVYYLENRPKYKYRRSGDKWQFQEKTTTRPDIWHWVTNPDSAQALTAQYTSNKAAQAAASGTKELTLSGKVDPQSYWTLITIIACENFSDNKQGMADTAQSIYNRFNVKGQPYGKTIHEIILASGQYQPVTTGKAKGAAWGSINTKDKAIAVYMKTKGLDKEKATSAIEAAISAQKDPTLIKNAQKFVGSRTEFLATKPTSKSAASPVERTPSDTNNAFFWNYAGKTHYYDEKLLAATAKPDTVKVS